MVMVLTPFLQTNVKHALEQVNLLSGVRNDIECVYVCLLDLRAQLK